MDNSTSTLTERIQPTNVNGSFRQSSPVPSMVPSERPTSLLRSFQPHTVQVVVNRDERGYGMKVSGDNPVYVQSVKEGGAAEKAGLHAGDKIIKVNDVVVTSSKHTDVVNLIRASSQVILTVQQRTAKIMGSPSLHNRPLTTPSNTRITGPQPVDHEKQYQLQLEKEQHYRLMIEKEQRYIDLLRSQIASNPDEKKFSELTKTEKNLQTLQAMLLRSQNEQSPPPCSPISPFSSSTSLPHKNRVPSTNETAATSPNGNSETISPPPLPKRNQRISPTSSTSTKNNRNTTPNGKTPSLLLNNEINANKQRQEGNGNAKRRSTRLTKSLSQTEDSHLVDNPLYSDKPPPLPPRVPLNPPSLPPTQPENEPDPINSLNKQMSYPLVATCATLVNDYSPNPTHHRTKSSPESLTTLSAAEASRRLIASESMSDLSRQELWESSTETPPGTPPPPYPSPLCTRKKNCNNQENGENIFDENLVAECSSPDGSSPFRLNSSNRIIANSSPIHAATPQTTQQPIISMEDDEISDQEISRIEDHGHFKSLSSLWEHLPHLAVFTNYVLSNSDPNSLLFYLLTDLYKEGNAKEMRKWAFEIHSCFLVPGAPLRLSNVDENIAHEIDDVLTREYDKEEILRKIFWKARTRAKEELMNQLTDFQQKRTAGLGTIFGPSDQHLVEIYTDKAKETKLYETLFLEKLEPYLEEFEKENYDPKRYYTAAALTTVLTRIFSVRFPPHSIDRCPTFVNKEKSFKTKLIARYYRKLNVQGHQFVANQYFTVILCNNCHQVIYGIGPQGYQCSVCLINLHRSCVKLYDDTCPGPINKKDRGLGKFIRIRHENNEHRRKHSSHFIQMEKERRQAEEARDSNNSFDLNESGEKQSQPVSRSGSDRRPDVVREEIAKHLEGSSSSQDHHDKPENSATSPESTISLPSTTSGGGSKKKNSSNINRSESVKEQTEKKKQRQDNKKRNKSDPSNNTTSGDVELDQPGLSNTDSGSSSNSSISYNGRSSESPSNSADVVNDGASAKHATSDWESDTEMVDWKKLISEEEVRNLQPHEKKRQDVINELFHTESTHVRNLRVLYEIFYNTLAESQMLKPDELLLIFPNIREILHVHKQINKEMKRKRHEDPLVRNIGDMLATMFGGYVGESLQKAAATFCERQQLALKFIQEKRRRDPKFEAILAECEKKPQCRRLPLQGIIPTEMQRLSKYPLLIERLINNLESDVNEPQIQDELIKLRRAHNSSKEILNYVDEATKLAMDRARLEEIQSHLDTKDFDKSEHSIAQDFKTIDLTKYKLIKEGTMQLRRSNKSVVPVNVLLFEEIVVILHKEGDRYLLKFFQSGNPAQPQPLSPIIKTSTLLARSNAVLKNSLFLVNSSTTNCQIYDLAADDEIQRDIILRSALCSSNMWPPPLPMVPPRRQSLTTDLDNDISIPTTLSNRRASFSITIDHNRRPSLITRWFKHFSDATNSHSKREGRSKKPEPPSDSDESETVQDLPTTRDVAERAEAVGGTETNSQPDVDEEDDNIYSDAQDDQQFESKEAVNSSEGEGTQTRISADDWPLIQPSQVHIQVPPVHRAESRLTPLEQIKRKDEEVRRALEDKEGLVADLLSIPREHFHVIADMAGDTQDTHNSRDPVELVMAAVYQVDQLHLAVNEALNISEATTVLATGGKNPSCDSQETTVAAASQPPSIPAHRIRDIATPLSPLLTNLLNYVRNVEDEREKLKKELHKMREVLHEQQMLRGPLTNTSSIENRSPSPPPGDLQDLQSITENQNDTTES